MRSIRTIIHRVESDLPITKEEYDLLDKHLDKYISRQRSINSFALIFTIALLVIFVILLGFVK
jgi:hypothetical protein